jgi:uncharacterized Zn finger protein
MVHYNPEWHVAQVPPPVCPKCGSHRTQVVGRSDDGRTVSVRCSSCGERSRIEVAQDEGNRPPAAASTDNALPMN